MTAIDIAREYIARGWAPIPIPQNSKNPNRPGWQKLTVTENNLADHFNGKPQNVGIRLGKPSGGLVDVDLDSSEALALAEKFLPPTAAIFGRPGKIRSHWLYIADPLVQTAKFPDPGKDIDDQRAMLVELRSTGGQTVFPGSTHPTGEKIAWQVRGNPAILDGNYLRICVARVAAAALLARHWPATGARQDAAMALGGGLLRAGWAADEARAFIVAVAGAAGDEEADKRAATVDYTQAKLAAGQDVTGWPSLARLVDHRVLDKARLWLSLQEVASRQQAAWVSTIPGNEQPAKQSVPAAYPRFALTDLGNCERLVARHGHDLRFCWPWSSWLIWDGIRWRADETGEIHRRAKSTVRGILDEARAEDDPDRRADLARFALKSEARQRLAAMVSLAQSEPGIPVTVSELDADPMALNLQNGTLNLSTMELRQHRRDDLLTKKAPVSYHVSDDCPTWRAFLERVMPDPATRSFIQRAVGYSLTGDVREQVLFFLYGSGSNGKSTFLNAILDLVGDYGRQAAPDLLVVKKGEAHPTEVADLAGVRFLATVEVEQGRVLAEALVKQLTGGDRLKARRMREDFWEFAPTHKIWLASNHRPTIRGTDYAIWRRIRLIPFTVTITENERDHSLPEKLRAERSGILAWAIAGCKAWLQTGLSAPTEVRAATDAFRLDMDVLGSFIQDRCRNAPTTTVPKARLYSAYKSWASVNGEEAVSQREFSTRLIERGVRESRTGKARCWLGLDLRSSDDGPDETAMLSDAMTDVTRNSVSPHEKNEKFGYTPNNVTSVIASQKNPEKSDLVEEEMF